MPNCSKATSVLGSNPYHIRDHYYRLLSIITRTERVVFISTSQSHHSCYHLHLRSRLNLLKMAAATDNKFKMHRGIEQYSKAHLGTNSCPCTKIHKFKKSTGNALSLFSPLQTFPNLLLLESPDFTSDAKVLLMLQSQVRKHCIGYSNLPDSGAITSDVNE